MRFDEHFLQVALPDAVLLGKTFPDSPSFSVDTRTLQPGDIFVALGGACVDGHSFIGHAFERGAAGVMLASSQQGVVASLDPAVLKNKLIIVVRDPLQALIRLAAVWRSQFSYPVVAITGSVGKTTTKEILAHILSANATKFCVSTGNQNTRIGLSLNIFKMRAQHEAAIFELGISRRGEMAELVSVLRPTTAVITAIGHSHMEGLGSLADIAQEKRDIFKAFGEDSIGIINGDNPILAHVGYAHPVIKFGTKTINQIQARKIHVGNNKITFVLKLYKDKIPVTINSTNLSRVFNSLAAAAAAYVIGIPQQSIVKGIQECVAVEGRYEMRSLCRGKGLLINDSYNASPESMKAALLALEQVDSDAQKVAVLGDMLELGVNSPFWHRQLGRFLRKVPSLKRVILVGDMVKWTKKTIPLGVQIEHVPSWQQAIDALENIVDNESVILVKGSHGMRLSNVVNHFTVAQPSQAEIV